MLHDFVTCARAHILDDHAGADLLTLPDFFHGHFQIAELKLRGEQRCRPTSATSTPIP